MSDPKITTLSCKSCGAAIQVPPDLDFFNCSYCGAALSVQRGDGYVALKMAERVSRSIEEVGSQTQSTIRQSGEATQSELKVLQIGQQLSFLQVQLSTLQAEIRSLERQKMDWQIRQQLNDLRQQESSLIFQMRTLQTALTGRSTDQPALNDTPSHNQADRTPDSARQPTPAPVDYNGKDWRWAFGLCVSLGYFGAHRFYSGHILLGFVYLFTFGGFLVAMLIDVFLLVTGRYKDAKGMPLKNRETPEGKGCLVGGLVFLVAFLIMVSAQDDPSGTYIGALGLAALAYGIHYIFFRGRNKNNEKVVVAPAEDAN
jgi:hypothetical protein